MLNLLLQSMAKRLIATQPKLRKMKTIQKNQNPGKKIWRQNHQITPFSFLHLLNQRIQCTIRSLKDVKWLLGIGPKNTESGTGPGIFKMKRSHLRTSSKFFFKHLTSHFTVTVWTAIHNIIQPFVGFVLFFSSALHLMNWTSSAPFFGTISCCQTFNRSLRIQSFSKFRLEKINPVTAVLSNACALERPLIEINLHPKLCVSSGRGIPVSDCDSMRKEMQISIYHNLGFNSQFNALIPSALLSKHIV